MAASLTNFTGQPKARSKLKPTHPGARLCGSATGLPLATGPGYPIDITSYFQSAASFLTPATIAFGVRFGPEGNLRPSCCPVPRIFTLVPPTSMVSTFISRPPCLCTLQHCALQCNHAQFQPNPTRSEEHRVGKECRSRWSPYH